MIATHSISMLYIYLLFLYLSPINIICIDKEPLSHNNEKSLENKKYDYLEKGKDVLLSHNVYRMKHNSEPLKWSDDLSNEAYKIQNLCTDCSEPKNYPAGTNFLVSKKPLSPQDVVDIWYQGIIDYDFYTCGLYRRNHNTLNFTQVIWQDSKYIGCSLGKCEKSELWVCKYSPVGNIQGKFCQNVKPISENFDEITPFTKPPFKFHNKTKIFTDKD